jgi:hypothetical protein
VSNSKLIWPVLALIASGASVAAAPVVDNERVTVWDSTEVIPHVEHDFVVVPLGAPGTAAYGHKGDSAGTAGQRSMIIELKDAKVDTPANPGTYPMAFPRKNAKKLFENAKVVVWSTRWVLNEPTPMHFHDKDAMVIFEDEGQLKSIALDGTGTAVEVTNGRPSFNLRNRVHSEVLVSGKASAVVTELK